MVDLIPGICDLTGVVEWSCEMAWRSGSLFQPQCAA